MKFKIELDIGNNFHYTSETFFVSLLNTMIRGGLLEFTPYKWNDKERGRNHFQIEVKCRQGTRMETFNGLIYYTGIYNLSYYFYNIYNYSNIKRLPIMVRRLY